MNLSGGHWTPVTTFDSIPRDGRPVDLWIVDQQCIGERVINAMWKPNKMEDRTYGAWVAVDPLNLQVLAVVDLCQPTRPRTITHWCRTAPPAFPWNTPVVGQYNIGIGVTSTTSQKTAN